MDIQITKLDGLKPAETKGMLVYCDSDDEEAIKFELSYIGSIFQHKITFVSRYKAEEVERAMHKVFKAGKKQTKKEFNQWIQT